MNFQQNFVPQYNNDPFMSQQNFNPGNNMMMGDNSIINTQVLNTQGLNTQVLNNVTNLQPNGMMQDQQMGYDKPIQQQQQPTFGMISQQQQPTISSQAYPTEPTTTSEQMYTKFEDLPNLGSNLDIVAVVNLLKLHFENKTNWKNPFDALDNLRILNKYYPNELNNIVAMFWKYIVDCIESPKTYICKNALIFITEVFMNSKNVRLHDDIISGLVPHVLAKASSDKGFMKKEAQNALKELTVNCCYDITVMVLCQQSLDKNPAIGDIAILTLAQMLNNIGENIAKLNVNTLIGLTRALAKTLDTGKHAEMKKYATMIVAYICKLYGVESFVVLIKNSNLTTSEELAMVKLVESRKESKRVSNLQEFKTERKKQIRMSQINSQEMGGQFNDAGLFGYQEGMNSQGGMSFMQGGNDLMGSNNGFGGFQQNYGLSQGFGMQNVSQFGGMNGGMNNGMNGGMNGGMNVGFGGMMGTTDPSLFNNVNGNNF